MSSLGSTPQQNVFLLRFDLTASISDQAVRPGETLTIEASTWAPSPPPDTSFACTWGDNTSGQLGDGTNQWRPTPGIVKGAGGVGLLSGVRTVGAGYDHSVALLDDGRVLAWGENFSGQLGDGTTTPRKTPAEVLDIDGVGPLTGVVDVSAGAYHTLALLEDGRVVAWGEGHQGQLGDGGETNRLTPVIVKGLAGAPALTGVVDIAAGYEHSLAVLEDGTMASWGWDNYGQLGRGGPANGGNLWRPDPALVIGIGGSSVLSGVANASAGRLHSLAALTDGTVVAWGSNLYGQLGDGGVLNSAYPVRVKGIGGTGQLSGVEAVEGGDLHSLALLDDGRVAAWGTTSTGRSATDRSSVDRRPTSSTGWMARAS